MDLKKKRAQNRWSACGVVEREEPIGYWRTRWQTNGLCGENPGTISKRKYKAGRLRVVNEEDVDIGDGAGDMNEENDANADDDHATEHDDDGANSTHPTDTTSKNKMKRKRKTSAAKTTINKKMRQRNELKARMNVETRQDNHANTRSDSTK